MGISVKDFSYLEIRGEATSFLEIRMDNNVNGEPVYVGYSKFPNADPAAAVWLLFHYTYDVNNAPTRQQIQDDGLQFSSIWNNRANYFS